MTIPRDINGLTVIDIGTNSFYDETNLASITIPNSVTNIGAEAFEECITLTNAAISSGVHSIGDEAFFGCINLANIAIPGSVTNIAYAAFADGTSLTCIEFDAFVDCIALTSVTIPAGVDFIVGAAFSGCRALSKFYCGGNAPTAVDSDGDSTVFYEDPTIVYYLPGTTGWSSTFADRPTSLWLLPNPLILKNGSTLGVHGNSFGFIISWATNTSVVVEVSTNLGDPFWTPLQTNALTNGWFSFSDPQWTNFSDRYYRVSTP